MMTTLIDWYPGDRALDFVLIVVFGVALLSGGAWLVSWRLPRRPATRHLVLVSAMVCCLAMPGLASLFTVSGLTLIAIPLLPAEPIRRGWDNAPGRTVDARVLVGVSSFDPSPAGRPTPPDPPFARGGKGKAGTREGKGKAGPRIEEGQGVVVPGVASGSGDKSLAGPERQSADLRLGWPSAFRAGATLALIAWCGGSVLLLLGLARSCWLVRQLCRSSSPLRDRAVRVLLDDVGRRLGVRKLPDVVVSRRAMTPFAVGFRRPIVVLPDRLLGAVRGDEMGDVLVHEVAHVRRGDHLVVLVQELTRALYWPVMTVHGLIRELNRAREELCDNHVLRLRDAVSYGETLLHLAELTMAARPLRATAGILHWKGELERRIAGLLDQRRNTMTGSSRWLACFVALLFIAGGTVASATRFVAPGREAGPSSQATPVATPPVAAPRSEAAAKKAAAEVKPSQNAKRAILIHTVGPDGRPMSGVEVLRSIWTRKPIKDRNNRRAVSDDRGQVRFELPEGMYIIRFWTRAKGHVPLFAHWEEEDDPERSLPEEFTFRLKPGTVIGGIVRNADGRPIQGVAVDVELKRGGERDGRTGPGWLTDGSDTPITDAEGRWTLDNVPPGDDVQVQLKFSHPDYVSDLNGTLQEEQGVGIAALRARTATITMRGGLTVTGTVTDPQGRPVAGAVVVRGDHPYWERGSQEVRTDDKGVYRLPPLPRGALTITAVAEGWMPAMKKIDVQPGMKPVDFRLEPGKELRLRIVDRAGKPIPGVSVSIGNWRGGESLYNNRHPNVLDTKIPNQADEGGLYRWTWAPGDPVRYRFWKEGYVHHDVDLTATGREQSVTLHQILRISGKVTDATTGRPVANVTAMPVIEFRPGQLIVERERKKVFPGGAYTIEGERTDVAYRVRVEAEGYRCAMSDAVRAGASSPTVDFRLEPAPLARGRVVDARGRPVAGARVFLATTSQRLSREWHDGDTRSSDQKAVTDQQGAFAFPAQFERYTIVAIHDDGYAEMRFEPDQQPGELGLRAWARVEGRLVREGQPVPSAVIFFDPIRLNGAGLPRIEDNLALKTDRSGRFVFTRVPPVKSYVKALLSVWGEWPIPSSRSVPLDLQPGQRVEVDLGGQGTTVTGRVVPSGDAAATLDLHKSLNWLVRRAPGIEPPPELRSPDFDARRGWSHVWASTPEGEAYLQTLDHYFVTMDQDGRFRVSGVPAGDYDLAIRLYEPPGGGCLVSPVGSRIVRVQVTEDAARGSSLDLGTIEVKTAIGPRPGEVVPDFAFASFSGEAVQLSDLRGRYVLLDFWATWCGPCVASLPALSRLHDDYGSGKGLVILGLNLDEDRDEARRFVESRKLPGIQGSLGGRADEPTLSRFAISFVPAYFLIGPDGKLIHRGASLDEIDEALRRMLR